MHPEKYGTSDPWRHLKAEDRTDYGPLSTNEHLHSKFPFPQSLEKHYPLFHDSGANTATGNIFSANISQYTHDVRGPTSSLHSLFQNTSFGSEEFKFFDEASTAQGLSRILDSGCALSLLSSHSQTSSSHLAGIPMACPLIMPSCNPHDSVGQVSERFIGISSQPSLGGVLDKFPSSEVSSVEENCLCPIVLSDGGGAVNLGIADGIFQGSVILDNHHSCENGPTIDLLQLSSQLQRVEHQRQSMQMKQENDSIFCLLTQQTRYTNMLLGNLISVLLYMTEQLKDFLRKILLILFAVHS